MNYTNELCKCVRVIHEMFTDRGIEHADDLLHFNKEELGAMMGTKYIFDIEIRGGIRIVFDMSSKFRWVETKKYVDNFGGANDTMIMYVIKEHLNTADLKKFAAFAGSTPRIPTDYQVFQLRQLLFNISRHMLVPKHELINDEVEINKIMANYQLRSRTQLPIILKTDPMAKYLYAKVGNLVRVTRISPTCGTNIVYRCVM